MIKNILKRKKKEVNNNIRNQTIHIINKEKNILNI